MLLFHEVCQDLFIVDGLKLENGILKEVGSRILLGIQQRTISLLAKSS